MDYQRNNRFRPTGGMNRQVPMAPVSSRATVARSVSPAVSESVSSKKEKKPCLLTIENAPSLAMVYSPCQMWHKLYDPVKALSRGTQFAELDKPFAGSGCGRRNENDR